MTIGRNGAANLNIFVFEVGFLLRDDLTGIEVPVTVGIHPMVKAPAEVGYQLNGQSTVRRGAGSFSVTKGGRGPWTISMAGSFGRDVRGFGPYLGNGDILHQRFVHEVVQMGEALTQDEVDAAVNVLTGTPFVWLLVKPYKEALNPTPYVNFWDFLNQRMMQVVIRSWSDNRTAARMGGASGAVSYRLQMQEAGPIVEGGLGEKILSVLFTALTLWKNINSVLETYTLGNILDAFVALAGPVRSLVSESIAAVVGQVASVQALMQGQPTYSAATGRGTSGESAGWEGNDQASSGLQDYFGDCVDLEEAASDAAAAVGSSQGDTPRDDGGRLEWVSAPEEGTNLDLEAFEQSAALLDVADAAAWQRAAGALYGMGRAEYQAFIEGAGRSGLMGPEVLGTIEHVVLPSDTLESIAQLYGTTPQAILRLNALLPHEALAEGRILLIPIMRPLGPQGIDGLPTFGSHRGQAAWGRDLPLSMEADSAGDFATVAGVQALEQGVTVIIEGWGELLLKSAEMVPGPVRGAYLSERLRRLLQSDRRLATVSSVQVEVENGAYVVAVTAEAINSAGRLTLTGSV